MKVEGRLASKSLERGEGEEGFDSISPLFSLLRGE